MITRLGGWDAAPEGLGGWNLNIHHVYDPVGRVIYFGDGSESYQPDIIQTIANVSAPTAVATGADGSVYIASGTCVRRVDTARVIHPFAGQCGNNGFSGDEGLATSALLSSVVEDVALGPDGSLYIADSYNNRIRKVDPQGIIHTVAGSGATGVTSGGFSGDGGPATQAVLNRPWGVDVTADGTIFIADLDNSRIRRVAPDGTITTVAGNGSQPCTNPSSGYCENVPATNSGFASPQKVRAASDGGFFVVDPNRSNVRRVRPDGTIYTFVGTLNGSGGTVLASLSSPQDIALGRDGSVYILDGQGSLVRRVDPSGAAISTVVDVSGSRGFSGDNGPAAAATIAAQQGGIRIGLDDTLYIADQANNRVRRVGTPLLGFSGNSGTFSFPSSDGKQVYVFDGTGRHEKTVDALTNAVIYQFGYDSAGRVATVTDVNGDVTTINRDASGNLTSIVGPFGQQTTFTADSNGYLASATDPAGQTIKYSYDANGLMQTRTDARGGLFQFSYDAAGRLTEDQDPAGGSKSFSRTDLAGGGWDVTMTTALGRQTVYQSTTPAVGAISRLNTFPTGLQSSLQFTPDGKTVTFVPDGTQTTTTEAPDPQFGMLSPVVSTTTKTPSGLTRVENVSRAVTLSNGNLSTLTETTNINGNAWTRLFNASTQTWTMTSPVGRQTTMTVDAAGRPTQIAVPNVNPVTVTYDAHGRAHTMTQGGRTWTLGYDANGYLNAITDPLTNVTSYVNDGIGRPTQTTLADSRVLLTGFDGNSNLTSVTLPSDAVHSLGYTPVDLLQSYTPPSLDSSSPATSYTYDADRALKTVTRPDGVTLTYGYETSTGRLSTIAYPQGTLSRTYDPHTGLLSSVASPSGETTTFAYDGFLQKGITWMGPVSGSLSLGFDNNFRVTSQAVNGSSLSFGYDPDGLMTQAGSLSIVPDTQNGRLTGTTLGNLTDAYTYDANGLLASYTASFSGTMLYQETIGQRDNLGRITQKTDAFGSETHMWTYGYDATGRLQDAFKDGVHVSHYGYDADDNRTTFTTPNGTITPTYDVQDRLKTYGAASYTYTANGELATKTDATGMTSYTYDALGNLLHVGLPSGTSIDYVVDGQGRRVGKKVNGTLVEGLLYQDELHVVAQLDGSGNVVARFVFGSKPNVPDYMTTSAGTFRIVSDHLGSPRLVVNMASGAVVERIDYDQFGNVTQDTQAGFTPFGFAGGLYDKDTGLARFGARDYDATVGRWTAKDPIRFRGGSFNLYAYALNDPINLRDPNGKDLSNCDIACDVEAVLICGAIGTLEGPLGAGAGVACSLAAIPFCDSLCHPPPQPQGGAAPAPPYSPPPEPPPICLPPVTISG